MTALQIVACLLISSLGYCSKTVFKSTFLKKILHFSLIFLGIALLATSSSGQVYIEANPTASQTITQPSGTTLNINSLNAIPNAAQFPVGVGDASTQINACLMAAVSSGTYVCDARSLIGTQNLSTNMFAGVSQQVTLLLPTNVIFKVSTPQVPLAGVDIVGSNAASASREPDFSWYGTVGSGPVFDLKDAGSASMHGILVDCNGTNKASVAINFSGGITDIFGVSLTKVTEENCSDTGFDNYKPLSFSITSMSYSGSGSLTGTMTSTFPPNWVGQLSGTTFQITGASNSSFNTPVAIQITITGSKTFSAVVPQGSWSPSNASGITGTLSSYSEVQDWVCDQCFATGNNIGFRNGSAFAKWTNSILNANTTYGVELFTNGSFSATQGVMGENGTDIYIAGNNALAEISHEWMENSTTGILGAASGVSGYTVTYSNSNLHSGSSSTMVNLSSAGSGTVNFIADNINPVMSNPTFTGNSAAQINATEWSLAGRTPTIVGFGSAPNIPTYVGIGLPVSPLPTSSGAYVSYNQSGSGEEDFIISQPSTFANYFEWYTVTPGATTLPSSIMSLTYPGILKTAEFQTSNYTVGTLPTCNSAVDGAMTSVTDASSPTFLGILTGGGIVHSPAYCNGTHWVAY